MHPDSGQIPAKHCGNPFWGRRKQKEASLNGIGSHARDLKKPGPKRVAIRCHVPIHDGFKAELKTWWKANDKTGPIIHYRKKPFSSIKTAWENTLIRAEIKRRLRPYDLRHNFITAALEEGADIGAVAAIVGSSPETMRRHYQHVTNRLRRQTVALIKQIEER